MQILRHDGLIQALVDFGADLHSQGFDLDLVVVPGINLQDLSQNYQPAVRARLTTRVLLGAGGAGNFSAFTAQADANGFWLQAVINAAATGVIVSVNLGPVVSVGVGQSWNVIGDNPGEIRANDTAADFFGSPALGSVTIPGAPGPGFQCTNAAPQGVALPLWVPGRAFLNVQCIVSNVAVDVSLVLQMPSNNPGRLP